MQSVWRNSGLPAKIEATRDFVRNYNDMRTANTIGADKYFHCKANREAANRGKSGAAMACTISDGREWFDQNIKGDSASASMADQVAYSAGRANSTGVQNNCQATCAQFRPNGLDGGY